MHILKSIFAAATLFAATSASAQQYEITVETLVGGKPADKFAFVVEEGDTQFKGFDGKLVAKKYRAKGYLPKSVNANALKEKTAKKSDTQKSAAKAKAEKTAVEKSVPKSRPIDEARAKLSNLRSELRRLENSVSDSQARMDKISLQLETLERVVDKGDKNLATFPAEYKSYLAKYEPVDEQLEKDKKIDALIRSRKDNSGDTEEFDVGSFCVLTLKQVKGKKLLLDVDYIYSHKVSDFYADGNSNGNTILKQTVMERLTRNPRNLVVSLNRPYCIQFARPKNDGSKSLSEAISQTSIIAEATANLEKAEAEAVGEQAEKSEFDAQGSYAEIRKKFPSGLAKTARIVITAKKLSTSQQ